MGLPCRKGCIHKRSVPSNCHVRCAYPDSSNVTGDPHGIKNGWFFYPFLFDPIWGSGCRNFETKEEPVSYDMQIGAESFNYTWNVGKMWRDIYPKDGIRAHYGKTGKEASEILTVLYMAMVFRKDKLIKMNPTNGWGDYYGALEFVHKLICASLRNPDEIWSGD